MILCGFSVNSAMVALNAVATQQSSASFGSKDLLIKNIVTAIEICGMLVIPS